MESTTVPADPTRQSPAPAGCPPAFPDLPTPYLAIDLDAVAEAWSRLARALPAAEIYYAVKANPAPEIIRLLDRMGSSFDCASIYEIDHCVANGVEPARLSFGSTIKKIGDIAAARELGVDLFAFDSIGELEKLAAAAPGARIVCRLLMNCEGADWTLSRKFGCSTEMARDLLLRAVDLGLSPYGVSFHVGSQQRDPTQWHQAIGEVKRLFDMVAAAGVELQLVNLGGGFPARYLSPVPPVEAYADTITVAMREHFAAESLPRMIVEPGRGIVADAGVIVSEVVLVSVKHYGDDRRWVYLDVGKFGGLPETIDEAIRYRITSPREGAGIGPVVLAGPTCDSMDTLYEQQGYELPLDLTAGDVVLIHGAGAYTASYSAVGFNGFPPLRTRCYSRAELEGHG